MQSQLLVGQQALRDELSNLISNTSCYSCLEKNRDTLDRKPQAAEPSGQKVVSGGNRAQEDAKKGGALQSDVLADAGLPVSDVQVASGSVQTITSSRITTTFVHSERRKSRGSLKGPSRTSAPAVLSERPSESSIQAVSASIAASEMPETIRLQQQKQTGCDEGGHAVTVSFQQPHPGPHSWHCGSADSGTLDSAPANSLCEGDFVVVVSGNGPGDRNCYSNEDGGSIVNPQKPSITAIKEKPTTRRTPRHSTSPEKIRPMSNAHNHDLGLQGQSSSTAESKWKTSFSVQVAVSTLNEKGILLPQSPGLQLRHPTPQAATTGAQWHKNRLSSPLIPAPTLYIEIPNIQ